MKLENACHPTELDYATSSPTGNPGLAAWNEGLANGLGRPLSGDLSSTGGLSAKNLQKNKINTIIQSALARHCPIVGRFLDNYGVL